MVMVSTGKGHRKLAGADSADMLPLPLLAGKALIAKAAGAMIGAKVVAGGAMMAHAAPQTDVQCNDVSRSFGCGGVWLWRCCKLCNPEVCIQGSVVETECVRVCLLWQLGALWSAATRAVVRRAGL